MIYRNKWARRVFTLLLVVFLGLSMELPSFAGAAQAEAKLIVSQEFTVKDGKEPSVGTAISYKLTPLESGLPMPEGTNADGEYLFTLNGTEQTTIQMTYDHAGLYKYQVEPVIEEEYEGYTYDRAVYALNVYVQNGKDGLLLAVIGIDQAGEKREEILYKFSYVVEGEDSLGSGDAKTGDTANILLYVIVAVVSLLVIVFFVISKRKKQDDLDDEDVDDEDDEIEEGSEEVKDDIKEEVDKVNSEE